MADVIPKMPKQRMWQHGPHSVLVQLNKIQSKLQHLYSFLESKSISNRKKATQVVQSKHTEKKMYLKYKYKVNQILTFIWCGADTCTLAKQAKNKLAAAQQNGKTYAQYHVQGQKDQHLGQRERIKVIDKISNVRKIRPMDLACHHLETTRQENMTRENSQAGEHNCEGEMTWTYTGWRGQRKTG